MDDDVEFLLALTVTAFRTGGGKVRFHVQRTDAPTDYGLMSPAELGYLIQGLLASTDPF